MAVFRMRIRGTVPVKEETAMKKVSQVTVKGKIV
jgi:hypothetical protein